MTLSQFYNYVLNIIIGLREENFNSIDDKEDKVIKQHNFWR